MADFSLLDEPDELPLDPLDDNEIEIKFTENNDNLVYDINFLDNQIQSIQKHVLVLESSINTIERILSTKPSNSSNNPNNPNQGTIDRSKLYAALHKNLEILSLYHSNIQRFLDLKHKYRKEQNDLKFRVTRLINVEMKNLKLNPDSTSNILEVLTKISNNKDPLLTQQFQNKVDDIDSETYSL